MKVFAQLTLIAFIVCIGSCRYPISKFEGLPFTVKPESGRFNLILLLIIHKACIFWMSLGLVMSHLAIKFWHTETLTMINSNLYNIFWITKFYFSTDIVSLEDDDSTLTVFIYSHGTFYKAS